MNCKSIINVKFVTRAMLLIIFIGFPLGWSINKFIGPLARVDIKVRPYFKRVYFADLRFWEYTQWGDVFLKETKDVRQNLTAEERVIYFYNIYLYCNMETVDWDQFVEAVLQEDMPGFIVELENLPKSPDYAILSESKRKMLSAFIDQLKFLNEEKTKLSVKN